MTANFDGFSARLGAAIAGRNRVGIDEPDARRAAVAVVIAGERDPSLLFIKRQERESDPWSGHVAFPGGFRSHPGEMPAETAQRETLEETALDLARSGTMLGALDDIFPRSVLLPRVVVTPCVFAVRDTLPVTAGLEVDRVLWIPVRDLFDPAHRKPYLLQLPTGEKSFDSIHTAGLVVWGLTERILQQIALLTA